MSPEDRLAQRLRRLLVDTIQLQHDREHARANCIKRLLANQKFCGGSRINDDWEFPFGNWRCKSQLPKRRFAKHVALLVAHGFEKVDAVMILKNTMHDAAAEMTELGMLAKLPPVKPGAKKPTR